MKFTIFYVTDKLAGPREHMFIFKVIQISFFLSQCKNSDKAVVQHFGKCNEKNCVYVRDTSVSWEAVLAGLPGQDQEPLEIFRDFTGNRLRTDCLTGSVLSQLWIETEL